MPPRSPIALPLRKIRKPPTVRTASTPRTSWCATLPLHPGYDRLRTIGFVFGEDKIDAAADELVHRRVGRRR